MKKKLSLLHPILTVFCLVGASNCVFTISGFAASQDRRDYVGLSFVASRGEIDQITATGFTNSLNVRKHFDIGAGLGLIRGYRWKNIPIHTEIEISHRLRYDVDVRDLLPNRNGVITDPDVGYEMNLSVTSILISAAYDLRTNQPLTPYFGGGFGWSLNTTDTERIAQANIDEPDRKYFSTNNLIWSVMVGAIWDWDEKWAVDIGYRYKDLGEIETGTLLALESVKATKFFSHDLSLAVVRRF